MQTRRSLRDRSDPDERRFRESANSCGSCSFATSRPLSQGDGRRSGGVAAWEDTQPISVVCTRNGLGARPGAGFHDFWLIEESPIQCCDPYGTPAAPSTGNFLRPQGHGLPALLCGTLPTVGNRDSTRLLRSRHSRLWSHRFKRPTPTDSTASSALLSKERQDGRRELPLRHAPILTGSRSDTSKTIDL